MVIITSGVLTAPRVTHWRILPGVWHVSLSLAGFSPEDFPGKGEPERGQR